ncbi:uncharacterized protein Dwil_GK14403 [Drosophila willistoni]|uniref:N-acetylneuraminate-9-phosphate synthase n=1 Tax=Drosophila willistoni TaxID=7260 RepID=B4NJF3_DROWI|nr:sialic acid synthase [Drosophila willistoni]EDW84984.1 uncharacterized protein Dwil_GK14403 [Drosophila willistoni]
MLLLDILDKKRTDGIYIIAEIGQNHQGSMDVAIKMIYEAKQAGCHCVKFQKSNLPSKFTRSALERDYKSKHSWGSTYGEHKEFLEFSYEQYRILQAYSQEISIDFTASAMDMHSLEFLAELKVPFIKIGSGDANNFPLLEKAANLGIPLVISTGMQSMLTVSKIVDIMDQANHKKYALMHCVSSYPTAPKDCNLQWISILKQRYPHLIIGYSGHELGITITKAAVLLGAKIIERHFTLDKSQKGSDHRCSLEPNEFRSLIRSIENFRFDTVKPEDILGLLDGGRDLEEALDNNGREKCILDCELPCRSKLGKSLVAARSLKKGHRLQRADIAIKVSEPSGLSAENFFDIIDKELAIGLNEDEPITGASMII